MANRDFLSVESNSASNGRLCSGPSGTMINDLGLQVHETAPDADTLMLAESENSDDIALEQAAEALAAVENETGRTTDPVRMYMREMGTVDLLTREGEIEIAKRIEEGMRDLLDASVYYPKTVEYVLHYFHALSLAEIGFQ